MAQRILVVDDEEVVCSMLNDLLTECGYEVFIAMNGEEGLRKANQLKPNLIILDINMPDVSGCGVSAVLEATEELRDIPVIFLTGYIDQEETARLDNRLAGHKLVSKPFDTGELISAVKDSLGA